MDILTYILSKRYIEDSLKGAGALKGKSAYEIACDNGFKGSPEEWLDSLKGETPRISDNGTWVIGEVDTGVLASPDLFGYATEDYVNKSVSSIPAILYSKPQELTVEQKLIARDNVDPLTYYNVKLNANTIRCAAEQNRIKWEIADAIPCPNSYGASKGYSALLDVIDIFQAMNLPLLAVSYMTELYNDVIALKEGGALVGGIGFTLYSQAWNTSKNYKEIPSAYTLTFSNNIFSCHCYRNNIEHIVYSYNIETGEKSFVKCNQFDNTLTEEKCYAPAKVVGEALAKKVDKDEFSAPIEFLAESGLIDPLISAEGALYVDNNDAIYSL